MFPPQSMFPDGLAQLNRVPLLARSWLMVEPDTRLWTFSSTHDGDTELVVISMMPRKLEAQA